MTGFLIYALHQIVLERCTLWIRRAGHVARIGNSIGWNAWRRRRLLRCRCRLEDNIKVLLEKQSWNLWTAIVWFMIGSSGGLL
jgi:hypothetical protein